MSATPIHDAESLTIWWGDTTRIIGIDWKETMVEMSDETIQYEADSICQMGYWALVQTLPMHVTGCLRSVLDGVRQRE